MDCCYRFAVHQSNLNDVLLLGVSTLVPSWIHERACVAATQTFLKGERLETRKPYSPFYAQSISSQTVTVSTITPPNPTGYTSNIDFPCFRLLSLHCSMISIFLKLLFHVFLKRQGQPHLREQPVNNFSKSCLKTSSQKRCITYLLGNQ